MLIVHAPRFTGSAFLADLRDALGGEAFETKDGARPAAVIAVAKQSGGRPEALDRVADARHDDGAPEPLVLVGLPRLALKLAPTLGGRIALILDGADESDARLASKLRGIRVVSFSFALYSALRRNGVDAAYFDYAPVTQPAGPLISDLAFIEPAAWLRSETLAMIRSSFGVSRFVTRRPRGVLERITHFLLKGVETPPDDEARLAQSQASVFVAASAQAGLNGGFLDALSHGAVVIAPSTGLLAQYMTHGVGGLIEGKALAAPPSRIDLGAAAQRAMKQSRRRFEQDRERLRHFLLGEPIARRTTAQTEWTPAPATVFSSEVETGSREENTTRQMNLESFRFNLNRKDSSAPVGTSEGGKRLRGETKSDAPDAPLVTIAIVLRNARETFAPTLASALAQDYPNTEIIVVDGDSTDGSKDAILSRDGLLDFWISEADKGPYDGMNKAARLARGRFLIFMNAGDFFARESAVSDAFASDAARVADVVVGRHVYIDADGVESLCKNNDFNWTHAMLAKGELSWDWYGGVPCGQAVFIKTELLREQPFDTSFKVAADHAFLYEARKRGKVFFHCDSVIGVYTSGGLSSADDKRTAADLLRIAQTYGPREKVEAWFRKNLPIAFG